MNCLWRQEVWLWRTSLSSLFTWSLWKRSNRSPWNGIASGIDMFTSYVFWVTSRALMSLYYLPYHWCHSLPIILQSVPFNVPPKQDASTPDQGMCSVPNLGLWYIGYSVDLTNFGNIFTKIELRSSHSLLDLTSFSVQTDQHKLVPMYHNVGHHEWILIDLAGTTSHINESCPYDALDSIKMIPLTLFQKAMWRCTLGTNSTFLLLGIWIRHMQPEMAENSTFITQFQVNTCQKPFGNPDSVLTILKTLILAKVMNTPSATLYSHMCQH